MEYLIGIIILLGALIFFHELGHFLVAKYFKVRVEVFSLGFGKKILKKRIGETEYCLSLIPLGGYVKLYGEDPTKVVTGRDANRSFSNQPVWNRIAIAAAGPTSNILFAIFVYFVIEVGGFEKIIVPYLANVQEGGAAWEAGLRSGDKILRVNQKEILRWEEDFLTEIAKYPEQAVEISYLRKEGGGSEIRKLTLTPKSDEAWNLFCEKIKVGVLDDISVRAAAPVIGITNPKSLGGEAGFETKDRIISLNGVKITYWHELKLYLLNITQAHLHFKIERSGKVLDLKLVLPSQYFTQDLKGKEEMLGLYSYEFFVKEAFPPGTAGNEADLRVGDRLISMNNENIQSWEDFRKNVQKYGRDPGYFSLSFDRGGELHSVKISPKITKSDHPCEQDKNMYQIGIAIDVRNLYSPLKLETYRQWNPIKAVYSATKKSFFMMYVVVKSLVKMIQGKVSVKSMGGPILIGKVAGDHLKQGLLSFLSLLAAISINLAVLNFLPIPILDGGHLFFFFCEVIFRRRPSEKILELANRAGLTIILALIVLAFYNDISRYWTGIVGFLKKLLGVA